MSAGWSFEDLDDVLVELPAAAVRLRPVPRPNFDGVSLVPEPMKQECIPARIRPMLTVTGNRPRRSEHAAALTLMCIEEDLSPEQALWLRTQHAPSLAKWGDCEEDGNHPGLAADVLALYEKHPHLGRWCFEVDCPYEFPLTGEMARLRELFRSLTRQPRHADRSLHLIVEELCGHALRQGHPEVTASQRDLADAVGLSRRTVNTHTQRARDKGWLPQLEAPSTSTTKRTKRLANTYVLDAALLAPLNPQAGRAVGDVLRRSGCGLSGATPALADAARLGKYKGKLGLGPTPTNIFRELDRGKATIDELVIVVNRTRRTVRDALKRLEAVGAAEELEGYWRNVDGFDWDRAVTEMGVAGRNRAQRLRHELDREAFDFGAKVAADKRYAEDLATLRRWQAGGWGKRGAHVRPRQ